LILSATMFIVFRRRFRQVRLTFTAEDGLDGHESSQLRRSEDMPPPNYRRIFPSDAAATEEQARAESEARVDAPPSRIWRIGRKHMGGGISVPIQFRPLAAPTGAALDGVQPQAPFYRAFLDASMWSWKGMSPPAQRIAFAAKTHSPPSEILEK
jgi:hypothetical protein